MSHELRIKWGVSRGRDTYGYTTAALSERGEVKARCNGGGYDMRGTVFAEWLQNAYQDRLVKLGARKFKRTVWNGKVGDDGPDKAAWSHPDVDKKGTLYGAVYYPKGDVRHDGKKWVGDPKPRVTLDGGCGFSSIQWIAEAIGLTVRTIDAGSKLDVILVEDTREEKA